MILTEKLQKYQEKIAGKIDKYEYLTSEDILTSNQRRIIEQAEFAYKRLGKALEKPIEKQTGVVKSLKAFNKIDKLK